MSEAKTATRLTAQFVPLQLGTVYITAGIAARIASGDISTKRIAHLLIDRHMQAHWGDMDADDRQANDDALINGNRVLSCYSIRPGRPAIGDNRVWIITEADRSATTILLPEEY